MMWYHVYSAAAAAAICAAYGALTVFLGEGNGLVRMAPVALLGLTVVVLIHWMELDTERFEVSGKGWWMVGLFTPVSLFVLMAYLFRSRGASRGLLACGVAILVVACCAVLYFGGMRVGELFASRPSV